MELIPSSGWLLVRASPFLVLVTAERKCQAVAVCPQAYSQPGVLSWMTGLGIDKGDLEGS